MANTLRSITVRKLIDLLEGEDPDAQVIFSTNYGDYHHTQQALPLDGEIVGQVTVEKSAYSNSGFALVDENGEEDQDDNEQTFLLIR